MPLRPVAFFDLTPEDFDNLDQTVEGIIAALDERENVRKSDDDSLLASVSDQDRLWDANAEHLAEVTVNPRPGIDDNPAIVANATRLFEQALEKEAEITPAITQVVGETGGTLENFEHRVKFEAAIRDKLFRDMSSEIAAERNPSWEGVANNVHDLNRYTVTWPADEAWVDNHAATVDALSGAGWKVYDRKDKNAWSVGDHYNGMNYQFTNGTDFMEVQFHTPESHTIKRTTHELYSQARTLPADDPQRAQLVSQIWDLWNGDTTHVPPSAETIGTPITFLMKRQIVNPQEAAYQFYVRTDDEGQPTVLFRTDGLTCEAWGTQTGQWHPTPLTLPEISGLGGSSDFWPVSDRRAMDFIMGKVSEAPRDIRAKGRPTSPKVRKRIVKADFSPTVKVIDTDNPQNLIFGWANVAFTKDGTQVEDHQGHMIDVEDLEHMAYNFVVKYRKSGDMHKSDAFGELVESMVYTPEKLEVLGLTEGSIPFGWWVGFRLPPEEASKVRQGQRSMLSIEGGARLELADD